MKNKYLLALCTIILLVILAVLPTIGGNRIDYPAMLMVDDVLYVDTFTPVTNVQEEDILGYTKSHAKKEPRKNGQANFSRGIPYASAEGGLAVQRAGQWILFKPYERKG